jgi:hypothetical protein
MTWSVWERRETTAEFWLEGLKEIEDLEELRWKNNIKIDLKEIGWESVEPFHLHVAGQGNGL